MTSSTSTGDVPHDSTDDEQNRLSRRSSVLNDLFSLFRRSSSFHLKSHPRLFSDREDDDDEDLDDDGNPRISKDRILEMIQQKKEIISRLREEAWSMSRKRKALIVAQKHLKKQKAKVSKVQLIRTDMSRGMKQFSRIFANLRIYLIPWEAKIKKIESHFGSVVSSYFTFLRWVLGFNLIISVIMAIFVIVPEWLADAQNNTARYAATAVNKVMPAAVQDRADSISTIVKLEGHFQYSLLFYGYYAPLNFKGETVDYRIPLAYFLANIGIIALSFVWILRKMAENARTSKISSGKTEQYVFNWKCFTGWDHTIGNAETALNVCMANVIKFREAIAEYNVKQREKLTCGRGLIRALTNTIVLSMLIGSVWTIYVTSQITERDTFWQANAVSISISIISLVYPNFFDLLGILEKHHPKFALKLQLCRVLILYIVNYISLFFSLFTKLNQMENDQNLVNKAMANMVEREVQRNASLNPNFYSTHHSRTIRDLLMPLSNLTFSYGSIPVFTTTPAPQIPVARRPWTTVLPDFGPFAVAGPRAVVTPQLGGSHKTAFSTQPIGPSVLGVWNPPTKHDLEYNNSIFVLDTRTMASLPDVSKRGSSAECWETVMGQEITNIVVMDMIITVGSILLIDLLRGLGVRYFNYFCCWNLEKSFPEYGEFKVAENVLHLANNQGMVWLGLFFVPLLPAINNIKLIIIMYIRGWACMTCNVPAKQIFRASRSNNFFLGLLLFMLFMSMIPFGFVIASRVPSKTCGPFAGQPHFYSVITETMKAYLSTEAVSLVQAVVSPGIIVPVIIFLILVIYFLFSLVRGLREANDDLTTQLTHERTEEKKKIFELAGGKKGGGSRGRGSIFPIWKSEKRKKEKSVVKKRPGSGGSDNDDSGRSLPRSTTSITNKFVPSLGSVSEALHSDSEGEADAERAKSASMRPDQSEKEGGARLTLRQRFLVCIGWADPKKYERIPMEDLEAGPNVDREEKGDGERRQLLSGSSDEEEEEDEERSEEEEGSSEEETEDRSYQTASQGGGGGGKGGGRSTTASVSRKHSYTNRSGRRMEIEYATPSLASPTTGESGRSTGSSGSSSTSNSRSIGGGGGGAGGGYARNQRYLEVANSSGTPSDSPPLYQNHKTVSDQHRERSARGSGRHDYREPDESFAGDVSTRPPSQDGSFRDDAPAMHNSSGEEYALQQHLHSSYTSAMLSPIMARVVFPAERRRRRESGGESGGESEEEEEEGYRPRDRTVPPLVPPHRGTAAANSHHPRHHHQPHHHREHGEPATLRVMPAAGAAAAADSAPSSPSQAHARPVAHVTRPPRFRISSSPPKTPNSEARRFEVHVSSSPKSSRARGRPQQPSSSSRKDPQAQTEV